MEATGIARALRAARSLLPRPYARPCTRSPHPAELPRPPVLPEALPDVRRPSAGSRTVQGRQTGSARPTGGTARLPQEPARGATGLCTNGGGRLPPSPSSRRRARARPRSVLRRAAAMRARGAQCVVVGEAPPARPLRASGVGSAPPVPAPVPGRGRLPPCQPQGLLPHAKPGSAPQAGVGSPVPSRGARPPLQGWSLGQRALPGARGAQPRGGRE